MPPALPEQLLLSDLLRRRVRCDQGLDHGAGVLAWMHPPVHRLLGWATRPSAFGPRREVWRLDQLRGLGESELFVRGEPAPTDAETLRRLPTLIDAELLGAGGRPLGTIADAAVELRTGVIRHYLVSRSDPRLPGSSRWRLAPDRIVDQQPGRVFSGLGDLDDLPLARASVRQEFLRRSRRWRDQMGEETARLRDQVQQAGGRLEGWLEEPPWDESDDRTPSAPWQEAPPPERRPAAPDDWIDADERALDDRERQESVDSDRYDDPDRHDDLDRAPERDTRERDRYDGDGLDDEPMPEPPPRRGPDRYRGRDDDDPWV